MITRTKAIYTSSALLLAGLIASPAYAFTPENLQDTNGDGVISADEILQLRQAQREQMLTQFDTDGDGELSRAERKAAKQARRAAMTAAHDSDGDGELSRAEKKAAKEARMAAIELQLDVNGDGFVSAEERAGFDLVKSERRAHKGKHGQKSKDNGDS